jgi:protein involved in polysaccharide export with SLBB domain
MPLVCARRFLSHAGFVAAFALATAAPALALIHPGDELQVTVFNHPDLSRKVTVDGSGFVSLPVAGQVTAGGLEPEEIASRIEHALDPFFKSPPSVGVELVNQTSTLFVSGGPGGVLKYAPGETLSAAIADLPTAGNASQSTDTRVSEDHLTTLEHSRIDLTRVGIVRGGSELGTFDVVALSEHGQSGPALVPGDTITLVDKPRLVKVNGAVASPGDAFLSDDEPLADALEQAGGVRLTAASAGITLVRDGQTQTVALGDALFAQPAQSGDTLIIPIAPRVSVAGMVNKPGMVTLANNFSLLNALYEAGGPTKWGNLRDVQLVRAGVTTTYDITALEHGNTSMNPALEDGDLVFVPEGHKIDFTTIFQNLLAPLNFLIPRPV